MYKRGQIEMIGLVIVVILIVIGLLLYLRFSVFRQEQPEKDNSLDLVYINNLMVSIFNIRICNENPVKVEEVLVMCLDSPENIFCGEKRVCEYAKDEIKKIMTSFSFRDYKKTSISIERGNDVVDITSDCEFGIKSYTTIVTPDNSYYTANFKVC